ncbi:hypothetical protein PHYBOEH_004452 [Phytophthora boehmeriae]|uniref:Uncharacterized protein n=1 Tax=Phytophthora boehmeriae TaxID=109152 RepID=A0A8T1WP03_9STRA|nr:hypothetical protein PHYBOEH_004452 [Phytophthora boehmeriae]
MALALLLTADAARALRDSSVSQQTGSTDTSQEEVGVVKADTKTSTTTMNTDSWATTPASSSLDSEKTVSFNSIHAVATTAPPVVTSSDASQDVGQTTGYREIDARKTEAPKDSSSSGDNDVNVGDSNQHETISDEDDEDEDSTDKDNLRNDVTTPKVTPKPTTKAPKPMSTPKPALTPTPAPTPAPTPPPTSFTKLVENPPKPGSVEAPPKQGSYSGSSGSWSTGQRVTGQSYETSSGNSTAEALEKSTTASASLTSSRSLDNSLMVFIIGGVAAVGALVVVVSRKVIKETGDDEHLERSSFY